MLDIRQPFEPTPDSATANGDGGRPAPPGTGGTVAPEANYFHRYSRGDIDHETTRYLSAATQIYINYARAVVRTVIEEPYRALPPSYGADPGVVARWALTSLVTALADETRKKKPKRQVVRSLFEKLAAGVAGVTALADAVTKIHAAVHPFM